tara:strand:- start:377 stop:535 length:159 start_codon:yes stop_codon:yes gene_type:complete
MYSTELTSVNESLADILLQHIAKQQLFNFIESVAVIGDLASWPKLIEQFGLG